MTNKNLIPNQSTLLNHINHQLRVPLKSVMSVFQSLLSSNLDHYQQQHVQAGINNVHHFLDIINDYLDLSKIETEQLDLFASEFDLRLLIKDIVEQQKKTATSKNLIIAYQIANDIPSRLQGDPGRVRQVLFNLVSNAIKFTDAGTITITVGLKSMENKQASISFAVQDTGQGIPLQQQTHLFQPIANSSARSSSPIPYTGLGLALSNLLVELMGSQLIVTSQVGKGTTFSFCTQFIVGPQEYHPVSLNRRVLTNKSALIISLHNSPRKSLKTYLASLLLRLEEVNSGPAAREKINTVSPGKQSFDFIIIDIGFGELAEIDLDISQLPEITSQEPIIILLSSVGMRGDIGAFKTSDIAAYFTDPFANDEIIDSMVILYNMKGMPDNPPDTLTKHALKEIKKRQMRILLVESDQQDRQELMQASNLLGYHVDVVSSSSSALMKMEKNHYNLALIDLHTAKMDGLLLVRQIRGYNTKVLNSYIPIIGIISSRMQEHIDKFHDMGINDSIQKPISLEPAMAQIERWAATKE